MNRRVIAATAVVLSALIAGAGAPRAETLSAAGLTISDEKGGFRLLAASGAGTLADPLVLVEELSNIGPAVLVIRGFKTRGYVRNDGIQALASGNLVVTKVVINASLRVWGGFDLELREIIDQPSPYGDGLSFDQMGTFADSFGSDRFTNIRKLIEPHDLLDFDQGKVDPGDRARFSFAITDPTPKQEFYLVQQPKLLLSQAPAEVQLAARRLSLRPSPCPRCAVP